MRTIHRLLLAELLAAAGIAGQGRGSELEIRVRHPKYGKLFKIRSSIMSYAKRILDQNQELEGASLDILCRARVLKQCPRHSGTYLDGDADIENAYKLANAMITRGNIELPNGVSRRDFTDIVKRCYEENCDDSCYTCSKAFDD